MFSMVTPEVEEQLWQMKDVKSIVLMGIEVRQLKTIRDDNFKNTFDSLRN